MGINADPHDPSARFADTSPSRVCDGEARSPQLDGPSGTNMSGTSGTKLSPAIPTIFGSFGLLRVIQLPERGRVALTPPGRKRGTARLREAGIGLGLVLGSVTLCLFTGELLVRALSDDPRRWELENFVTHPARAQDHWSTMRPHPVLGWEPRPGYSGSDHGGLTFDARGLRVHRRNAEPPAVETPPVLVMGDSYAMGEEVADEETFPAHLQDLLDRRVLNGGVAGYGIDQMVMRAEMLVPVLRPDLLIVSFIGDDVRRSQERVLWGIEAPYFDAVGDTLELRNVPVPRPEVRPIDAFRRIAGYSFAVDVTMARLDLLDYWLEGQPRHREAAHDDGRRVSCLLMGRLAELGRANGAKVLVVAQYTPLAWQSESTRQFEMQDTHLVLGCAEENGLATLDTGEATEAAVRDGGLDAYYADAHLNSDGNRLVAEQIAEHLRRPL